MRYSGGDDLPKMQKKLFTFDEYSRMAEVGLLSPNERVELIWGEILIMTPIGPRHNAAVDRANRSFVLAAGEDAIVRVQGTVVLDRFAAPEPDLVLLRPRDDFYVSKHPGPEDILLIVEAADSSLEYDNGAKLNLYAILGVQEYWVADLQNNRLLAYSDVKGDAYQNVRELHRGNVLSPRLLPNCKINVEVLLP